MNCPNIYSQQTLAIAIGANIPSKKGHPCTTLIAIRPVIEEIIQSWISSFGKNNVEPEKNFLELRFRWSPLFETKPIGGPINQPNFINAVVLIDGPSLDLFPPSKEYMLCLLNRFLDLEKSFGRERKSNNIPWGPRPIDIDLLSWGELQIKDEFLTIPHPRLIERDFVVIPLAEALLQGKEHPRRIAPQPGWEE